MTDDALVMWGVSSGSYSDYGVHCICDSKERAETVAAAMRVRVDGTPYCDDAFVEEFALITSDPEIVTLHKMSVEVLDDGTTRAESITSKKIWPFARWEATHRVSWRWVRAPYIHRIGGRLDVEGTDLEAVRHVYSDRRAQLLAVDAFRMKEEAMGRGR
jgi:hypothetical protein